MPSSAILVRIFRRLLVRGPSAVISAGLARHTPRYGSTRSPFAHRGPQTGGRQQEWESAVPQTAEPKYLRTAQVAELLQVSPRTVSRWAQEGMLPYFRTLGGHRRYPDPEIRALLETLSEPSSAG